MISKTIGYNGVHNIFRHTHLDLARLQGNRASNMPLGQKLCGVDSWGCAHAGYVAEQKPTGTQLKPSAPIIAEETTSSIADIFDDFRLFLTPKMGKTRSSKPPIFR